MAARAGVDELRRRTIPGQLALRARESPGEVAYRAKIRGIYRSRTWSEFRDLVARCAFGLRRLGLAAGDRVAIMGDCCEGWTIADLAAQSLGAVSYGIYPTASPSEVRYQCEHGGARVFVAEDQEYADKVLGLDLPELARIVVLDTTGMFGYDDARLVRFDELLASGEAEAAKAGAFDALISTVRPEDPAFIVYTSGTTGNPKGAQIGHGKHLAATHAFLSHYPTLADDAHRAVAFLPLGHVMGRISAITLPLLGKVVPHYGESLDELPRTLFEIAPTFLFTVPRYLQKLAAGVLVGIEGTSGLKRAAYQAAFAQGRRFARRRWRGSPAGWESLLYSIARQVAFRPILNKLGLDRIELVIVGGAATGAELAALWQIWGLNLVEVYGQTESSGAMIAGQKGPFPPPGSVGVSPEHWEVRLGDDGEILARSPEVFDGYWRDAAATAASIDAEGWLHTGDVGAWQDGELRVVDRLRDIIVTSGGKTLSPTYVESRLRASPFVAEAVVFGDDRKYLAALIEIEVDTVSDWARRHGVAHTGFASLVQGREVTRLIAREVENANTSLARVEQIKAFRIIPKMLDPEEEGEPITPTRKVKRRLMYLKFRDLVESMYSHDEEERLHRALGEALATTD